MVLLSGVVALVIGCLLGWLGRYFVIEPEQVHDLCTAASPLAWCAVRASLIAVTFRGTWGIAAVAAAVLVWVLRGRGAATVALLGLFCGGLGLFLYDTAWAASAVLGILLRLPRIGEEPPNPREFTA
jgi:hypothetical protein